MIIGSNMQAVAFTGEKDVTIKNQSTLVESYNPIQQEAKDVFEVGQMIGGRMDKIMALVLNESNDPLSVENKENLETLVKNIAQELKLNPKQEEKLQKITSKAMENVSKMSPEEKQKLIKCIDKVDKKDTKDVNCIAPLVILALVSTAPAGLIAVPSVVIGLLVAIIGMIEHTYSYSPQDANEAFKMICLGALL